MLNIVSVKGLDSDLQLIPTVLVTCFKSASLHSIPSHVTRGDRIEMHTFFSLACNMPSAHSCKKRKMPPRTKCFEMNLAKLVQVLA